MLSSLIWLRKQAIAVPHLPASLLAIQNLSATVRCGKRSFLSFPPSHSSHSFSLFCTNRQKLTPSVSISCALFQNEYFSNPFQIDSLRTLLQSTGGGTLSVLQHPHSLPTFSTAHSSGTPRQTNFYSLLPRCSYFATGGRSAERRSIRAPLCDPLRTGCASNIFSPATFSCTGLSARTGSTST